MKNPYFIMIYNNADSAVPLIDDDYKIVFFKDVTAALNAAIGNDMAQKYGFDIFELGMGVL